MLETRRGWEPGASCRGSLPTGKRQSVSLPYRRVTGRVSPQPGSIFLESHWSWVGSTLARAQLARESLVTGRSQLGPGCLVMLALGPSTQIEASTRIFKTVGWENHWTSLFLVSMWCHWINLLFQIFIITSSLGLLRIVGWAWSIRAARAQSLTPTAIIVLVAKFGLLFLGNTGSLLQVLNLLNKIV